MIGPSGRTIRVMTWNIHGTLGLNPRFDLALVTELIARNDPDIVALQEVDSRRSADPLQNPFSMLKEAIGDHGIGAESITTADGTYGQALISRWPLHDTEIHDISYGEREPRRAIKTHIETPCGPVLVVATHLGLSVHERRTQARALLNLIGDAHPAILLGDFNDWFWPGSVRSVLREALPGRSRHRTFPSRCPIFRFDRVYCRPRVALARTWTDPEARHISDHLPVIADCILG